MNDKIAVITGGRRGIGRGCGVELARAGYNVMVVDIERDEDAETTLVEMRAVGATAEFLSCDVADTRRHSEVVAAAGRLPGRLTCLVNNAGVSSLVRGDMLQLSEESYDRVMSINLRASFFLSQCFAKHLIAEENVTPEKSFRCIVNITSANAEILGLDRADYTLSKSAMSMMTRLYAARLAAHRIHVYEVRPGLIKTEMTAEGQERNEAFLAAGGVPFNRWGYPEDIGLAVAMLASGGLPFTTGDHLWVDGGVHLRRP